MATTSDLMVPRWPVAQSERGWWLSNGPEGVVFWHPECRCLLCAQYDGSVEGAP